MLYYGGGYEPDEYGAFFVYAKAQTARRAKVIALRWFRHHEWRRWRYEMMDDECPFTGMHAAYMCPHVGREFDVVGPEGGTEWLCDCTQCEETRIALTADMSND